MDICLRTKLNLTYFEPCTIFKLWNSTVFTAESLHWGNQLLGQDIIYIFKYGVGPSKNSIWQIVMVSQRQQKVSLCLYKVNSTKFTVQN